MKIRIKIDVDPELDGDEVLQKLQDIVDEEGLNYEIEELT